MVVRSPSSLPAPSTRTVLSTEKISEAGFRFVANFKSIGSTLILAFASFPATDLRPHLPAYQLLRSRTIKTPFS